MEYRVRHHQHDEQESKNRGRHQKSLKLSEGCWRQEYREPALEGPHASEERRLKPRTPARGLGDLEQQLSVRRCVTKSVHDAIVAIHLDRQAQPPQLPPHREIPRHQDYRQRRQEKKLRVVRSPMLLLVTQDILPLHRSKALKLETWVFRNPVLHSALQAVR
jgi:hypothetical protein